MTEETNIEVAIEETLPIVKETIKATKTIKYNLDEFIQALCCPVQFGGIIDILPTLSKDEVKTLRTKLREVSPGNVMHHKLEHKFRVALGEE